MIYIVLQISLENPIYCDNLSQWMYMRERWQNLDFHLKRKREIEYSKIWALGRTKEQALPQLTHGCYCSINT